MPTSAARTTAFSSISMPSPEQVEMAVAVAEGGGVDEVVEQGSAGLTEARKIATLADGYAVPIAPHDCTGPVTLACSTHLVSSQPNGLVQETVRAFLRTWYRELVVGVPLVEDGHIALGDEPGHGVRLRDDLPPETWVSRVSRRFA